MLLPWMVYAAVLAALLAVTAAAAERIARARRWPTRGIWVGALLLSLLAPVGVVFGPHTTAPTAEEPIVKQSAPSLVTSPRGAVALPPLARLSIAPTAAPEIDLDAVLLGVWALGSGLLALRSVHSLLWLRRERRGWRRGRVCGRPVWISPHTGPAVVGALRMEIVLPERLLGWEMGAQRLVLEHEREHQLAGDPRLLALGWLAVLLVPWNPLLWWELRRLRLAVEIDCDARVLRHRTDVRRYGMLLLEVGRFASSPRFAAAFGEPRSTLERRIRAMTENSTLRPAAALSAVLAVVIAGAGACAVPQPSAPALPFLVRTGKEHRVISDGAAESLALRLAGSSVQSQRRAVAEVPLPGVGGILRTRAPSPVAAAQGDTTQPRLLNAKQIVGLLKAGYPPLLRDAGVTGTATVEIRIGADGKVQTVRALNASHEQFGDAALRVARQMRFRSALVDGRSVPFLAVLPIVFTLPLTESTAPGDPHRLPPLDSRGAAGAYGQGGAAPAEWVAPSAPLRPEPLGEATAEMQRRSAELQRESVQMQRRSVEMQRRGEEMRRRSEEMRGRVSQTQEAIRKEIERGYPDIARRGLTKEQYFYIAADVEGKVLKSGILPVVLSSNTSGKSSWSTASVERQIEALLPGVRISNAGLMMGMEAGPPGRTLNAAWVTVEDGAPLP